jgi:hypothetical protein
VLKPFPWSSLCWEPGASFSSAYELFTELRSRDLDFPLLSVLSTCKRKKTRRELTVVLCDSNLNPSSLQDEFSFRVRMFRAAKSVRSLVKIERIKSLVSEWQLNDPWAQYRGLSPYAQNLRKVVNSYPINMDLAFHYNRKKHNKMTGIIQGETFISWDAGLFSEGVTPLDYKELKPPGPAWLQELQSEKIDNCAAEFDRKHSGYFDWSRVPPLRCRDESR